MAQGEHVRRILHCDMDCYYAAVHVRDDPSLAGRPVVVGGDPEGRGVVASANYEARRFGIHSAMPASRAKRLCPQTVFLAPDFPVYRRESDKIFAIYREITPEVETVSLDEAYLDVTDHLGPSGTASAIAKEIRRRVREERGLTVSVGVGPNCLVAKIASDACKPDGLKVVPPERVQVVPRSAPGAPAARGRARDRARARGHGGGHGRGAARAPARRAARALPQPWPHPARVRQRHRRAPRGAVPGAEEPGHREHVPSRTSSHIEAMDEQLDAMAGRSADGLVRRDIAACTVTLKVRYPDFTTVTRSRTFPMPTADARRIGSTAKDLLRRTEAARKGVRLLGVTASTLVPATIRQLELFDDA